MRARAKKWDKIVVDATKSPIVVRLMAGCASFWHISLCELCIVKFAKTSYFS